MHAIQAFHAAGKAVGVSTFATDEETLKRYYKMGITVISSGADYEYVLKGAKATRQVLEGLMDDAVVTK